MNDWGQGLLRTLISSKKCGGAMVSISTNATYDVLLRYYIDNSFIIQSEDNNTLTPDAPAAHAHPRKNKNIKLLVQVHVEYLIRLGSIISSLQYCVMLQNGAGAAAVRDVNRASVAATWRAFECIVITDNMN